jgi:hypothetical protein
MVLLGAPVHLAALAGAAHTAATDIMGHSGPRRNRLHGVASLAAAALVAAALGCPQALALGPLHIALDCLSPGRLAVSRWYNALWAAAGALLVVALVR